MSDHLLEAFNLTKKYDGFTAVNSVNFAIPKGQVFSLLGPNGAGKSTTISMLSCLLSPTDGDATIDGHSIVNAADKVKNVIGFVPQDLALYGKLTAKHNRACQ